MLLHSHWALGTLRLLYLYYERKVSVSMKFTKSPSSSHHLHHHLIIVIFIVIIIIIIIQIFPHAPNRLSRQFNFRINSTSCLKVLHILIMIMSFPYFDNCLIKHCGDFGDNDDYCDHEQFNFSINSTFYQHCGDFGDNDDYCDHEQFNFSINSTFYLEKFSIS